jgi:hypothetical protein
MKLLRWMIFSVIVALTPLWLNAVILLTKNKSISEVPVLVLAGGELLLISTAIAADAIGDLIATGSERDFGRSSPPEAVPSLSYLQPCGTRRIRP